MTRPNRRAVVAGALAALSTGGLKAAAQATPEPEEKPIRRTTARDIMRGYLREVWAARDATAIADYLDPDAFDLMKERRALVIMLDSLDETDPVLLSALTDDGDRNAMAHCVISLRGKPHDLLVRIHINEKHLIDYYRWIYHDPEQSITA